MILVLASLIELHKPLNAEIYRSVPSEVLSHAPAFRHIAEAVDREWYVFAYYPQQEREAWGRDTLEVVTKDGHTYRAIEQFATTPDNQIVRLGGYVSTGDLYRRPLRHGQAVTLLVAFRERFSVKGTQVRLAGPQSRSIPAQTEPAG